MLKDRVPAYLSGAQFERNLQQVEANRVQSQGAMRPGPALLAGLVICGRCGLRMAATYHNNGRRVRYECSRLAVDYGAPRCQSLVGPLLDDGGSQ